MLYIVEHLKIVLKKNKMAFDPKKFSNVGSIQSNFSDNYSSSFDINNRKDDIAYAAKMGASDSARGISQIFGNITGNENLLEELKKRDEKLKIILNNPEYGSQAFQAYLGSAIALDPIGWIPVAGWAKKSKSLADATKYGVGLGAMYGATSYVGEGQSRALNSVTGATTGGLLGLGAGAITNKISQKLGKAPVMPSVSQKQQLNIEDAALLNRQNQVTTVEEAQEKTQLAIQELLKKGPSKSNELNKKLESFYTSVGSKGLWDKAVQNWGAGLVGATGYIGGYNAFNDPDASEAQKIAAGLLIALAGGAGAKAIGKVTLQSGDTIGETMSKLVVDNYGLPKNYKDYVQQSFGETNQLGQQFLRIVQKSQTLSRDERKVLYGMITGEVEDLPQLVGFSREARDVIKRTGQEMVDAGLLSEKVFQKNVNTYLHRSYLKHLKDKNTEGYQNALQFKIIGDELRPRGAEPITITQKVYEQSFNPANKTYNRYSDYEVFNTFNAPPETKRILFSTFNKARTNEFLGKTNKYKNFRVDVTTGKNGITKKDGKEYVNLIQEKPMVTLRRDFTKEERVKLGEIEDASFAIAETGRLMTNDLAVYKLYSKIANDNELSLTPEQYKLYVTEGKIKSENWIQMPDTSVPNATINSENLKRYGQLSDKYVPKEVYNDLTQRISKLKEGDGELMSKYLAINRLWKKSKTAWNPVVHMNNTVSNVILYDLAGADYKWMRKGFTELSKGRAGDEGSELYQLAKANGVFDVDLVSKELNKETVKTMEDSLALLTKEDQSELVGAAKYAESLKKASNKLGSPFKKLEDLYQIEDQAFRMGVFMDRLAKGMNPAEAAADAKKWFIDYDINAPLINMMRRGPTPFLSYTYRVVPLLAEAAVKRPHKYAKWATGAYMLNKAGEMASTSDTEKERTLMRKDLQQTLFGFPNLPYTTIRLPFDSARETERGEPIPLYIDIKRFIPGGDVFALGAEGGIGLPIGRDKSLKLPASVTPNFGAIGEIMAPLLYNVDPFTLRQLEGQGLDNEDAIKWQHILSRLTPNIPSSAFTAPLFYKYKKEGQENPLEYNPFAQSFGSKKVIKAFRQAESGMRSKYATDFTPFEAIISTFGFKLQPIEMQKLLGIRGAEFQRKYSSIRKSFYQIEKELAEGKISKSQAEKDVQKLYRQLDTLQKNSERLSERLNKVTGGLVESEHDVPYTKENPIDRLNSNLGESYRDTSERLPLSTGGLATTSTPLENELYNLQRMAESKQASELPQQDLYSSTLSDEMKRMGFSEGGENKMPTVGQVFMKGISGETLKDTDYSAVINSLISGGKFDQTSIRDEGKEWAKSIQVDYPRIDVSDIANLYTHALGAYEISTTQPRGAKEPDKLPFSGKPIPDSGAKSSGIASVRRTGMQVKERMQAATEVFGDSTNPEKFAEARRDRRDNKVGFEAARLYGNDRIKALAYIKDRILQEAENVKQGKESDLLHPTERDKKVGQALIKGIQFIQGK